jgi:hypothetical protein
MEERGKEQVRRCCDRYSGIVNHVRKALVCDGWVPKWVFWDLVACRYGTGEKWFAHPHY